MGRRNIVDHAAGRAVTRALLSAAVAGVLATVAFTALHDLISSSIWFTLPVMAPIGALCGVLLYWSFARLAVPQRARPWFVYHVAHFGMLGALGVVSIIVFEPVTTVAALIAANEPPRELTARALPLIVPFTLGWAAVFGVAWARTWTARAVLLLTCTVLMAALGTNIAILGLVQIPMAAAHLVGRLFLMNAVLILGFAAIFWLLERRNALAAPPGKSLTPAPRPSHPVVTLP
jgi:hypothetical protein